MGPIKSNFISCLVFVKEEDTWAIGEGKIVKPQRSRSSTKGTAEREAFVILRVPCGCTGLRITSRKLTTNGFSPRIELAIHHITSHQQIPTLEGNMARKLWKSAMRLNRGFRRP
jgi:hypothetical protein